MYLNALDNQVIPSKTSFEKKLFFCVGEYAEYGFDQQG